MCTQWTLTIAVVVVTSPREYYCHVLCDLCTCYKNFHWFRQYTKPASKLTERPEGCTRTFWEGDKAKRMEVTREIQRVGKLKVPINLLFMLIRCSYAWLLTVATCITCELTTWSFEWASAPVLYLYYCSIKDLLMFWFSTYFVCA